MAALAALIVARGGAKEARATTPSSSPEVSLTAKPVPSDLRAAVERASRIGRILYEYDRAAATGTDVLLENTKPSDQERRIGGFLAMRETDSAGAVQPSFTVIFFGTEPPPKIVYRVRVPMKEGARATFAELRPPVPVGEAAGLLIRARQTAIGALQAEPEPQPLNPVVLPARVAIGEDGILVYMIATTKRPDTAVFGKHYRVLVSADGKSVKRFEPLSTSALELSSLSRPGTQAAYMVVTHSLTPYPLETHVLASLLHRVPVFVLTPRGTWRVDGDRIEFLGGTALTRDGRPDARGPPPRSPACADICASVLAARCPRGPQTQADCTGPCEQFRSSSCTKQFQALFDCAGTAPRFACDAHGSVTVTGCETRYNALLSCLARQN